MAQQQLPLPEESEVRALVARRAKWVEENADGRRRRNTGDGPVDVRHDRTWTWK